ncbi:hypothetical protein KC19_7G049900 [Ceratodon purpureus]|uniref:Secreted protein n=1 Tax=Ceratodon purpureus TaxID=3225 RepID=A0A8T0H654_CERPU|nr:hypothetical protein KC19_7G049900 [Ceratodon purpureus]
MPVSRSTLAVVTFTFPVTLTLTTSDWPDHQTTKEAKKKGLRRDHQKNIPKKHSRPKNLRFSSLSRPRVSNPTPKTRHYPHSPYIPHPKSPSPNTPSRVMVSGSTRTSRLQTKWMSASESVPARWRGQTRGRGTVARG